MKSYNNVTYDRDKVYRDKIDDAAAKGDYLLAGMLEQQRNAKIDGENRTEEKTYDYSRYLEPGADSGFGSATSKDPGTGITADDVDVDEYNGGRGYSYNSSKDKTYQNLVKQVQKNAEFVGDNTLGRFSAMTGGIPSSYAVSAAANAQADVLDDINDIYAEREAVDYSRYLDELDRESAKGTAEEDARRWDLEYGLSKQQSDADVAYTEAKTAEQLKANEYADDIYLADIDATKADTELTRANTAAQGIENDYAARLNEAELASIYADTDLTKAKTAGQNIDNQFAPYTYLDELAGEGDTSTEEMTVADILNKANSGGYLTDAEYAMLDRAKENILAKVGANSANAKSLTSEEMDILRAFGYTTEDIANKITYDSESEAFSTPTGSVNPSLTKSTAMHEKTASLGLDAFAQAGENALNQELGRLYASSGTISKDEVVDIYLYYKNMMGWK